ncbi:hypothetical protein [Thermococcus sp.]
MPVAEHVISLSDPEGAERAILSREAFLHSIPNSEIVDPSRGLVRIHFKVWFLSISDVYSTTLETTRKAYVYHLKGTRSRLTIELTPEKKSLRVVVTYTGFLSRLVSSYFKKWSEELVRNLEKIIESLPRVKELEEKGGIIEVDFEDPESFKRNLYRFMLLRSEKIAIGKKSFPNVLNYLIGEDRESVYYISGITKDGSRRFQVLVQNGNVTSVLYVENDRTRKALFSKNPADIGVILNDIDGEFLVNVWKKVRGV